ncbi:MAG TPA: hypothetical protein VMF91_11225 [Bryobacteraceae bacterium]|nr:hypothetical protein [Bryobacteraceae bacterium]
MTIVLKPEQERVIQQAIESGVVGSVDEFIDSAVRALAPRDMGFDKARARVAGGRIRELRKGVKLDLDGMSIREFAHIGHKY